MVIGRSESIMNILNYELQQKQLDTVIILGSQFPNDQDDYFYNILDRIMVGSEKFIYLFEWMNVPIRVQSQ